MENRWGGTIYKARRAKGLSQSQLSKLIGVSRQTVSQWENDKFQPSSEKTDLLCQVLELSREEFLGEAGGASRDSANLERRTRRQKFFTILIAVLSAAAVILAIITVLMGFICLTSNTGDMMDNSYSIPQYVFYVVLAVTLILMLADVGVIARKNK